MAVGEGLINMVPNNEIQRLGIYRHHYKMRKYKSEGLKNSSKMPLFIYFISIDIFFLFLVLIISNYLIPKAN